MFKLTDETTEAAWDEFKNHLIDCGFLREPADVRDRTFTEDLARMRLAKMVFKQGFVNGSRRATEIWTPIHNDKPRTTGARKTKVFENGRVVRNDDTVISDNLTVMEILRENIDPMPLADIIKAMNKKGCKHWNNNNASGFMKMAMDKGCRITKIERGVYAFDWIGGE